MNYFPTESIQVFLSIKLNFIKIRVESNVFVLTLSRPDKRNAFTPTMVKEIAYALAYAESQPNIWCVVIEAEGSVFCAGMDLKVFQNPALDTPNHHIPDPNYEITLGDIFGKLNKPSIAKIAGNVYGGGFLIIAGCSFAIASENATFSLPEVQRGLFPMQVMASLLKIMPRRTALEMCILGKTYDAPSALDLGIITRISKEGNLDADTKQLVENVNNNSPFAIKKGLEAFNTLSNISSDEHHVFLLNKLKEIQKSADAQEGLLAFEEKRKPNWSGL